MDRILTREVHRNPPERTDIEQKEVKLPSLENIRNNSEDIETIRGSVKFLEEFRKEAELNSRSAIDDIQRKRLRTVNAIRSTILMINNLFSSNTYDRQTGEATWENHHAGLHPEGSWYLKKALDSARKERGLAEYGSSSEVPPTTKQGIEELHPPSEGSSVQQPTSDNSKGKGKEKEEAEPTAGLSRLPDARTKTGSSQDTGDQWTTEQYSGTIGDLRTVQAINQTDFHIISPVYNNKKTTNPDMLALQHIKDLMPKASTRGQKNKNPDNFVKAWDNLAKSANPKMKDMMTDIVTYTARNINQGFRKLNF